MVYLGWTRLSLEKHGIMGSLIPTTILLFWCLMATVVSFVLSLTPDSTFCNRSFVLASGEASDRYGVRFLWAVCKSQELQKSGSKHGVVLISLMRHIVLVDQYIQLPQSLLYVNV